MLTKKLLRCRACRLKWFPTEGTAAACPACASDQLGGTLELFHVGILLMAIAPVGWMVPSLGLRALLDIPVATSAIAKRSAPEGERARPAAAIPAAIAPKKLVTIDAQRSRPLFVPAIITAKKLKVEVERGPAEGRTVTFRRGDKVTILRREDRRTLVKDRRGNQAYVPSEKVHEKKSTRAKRRG
jgi:hypothetical protein